MHLDAKAILSAYAEGRHEEAASMAFSLTERFPLQGFGWMALGVVLRQMKRSEEALPHLQKGAALSPGNADAHNNLGIALMESGRLVEAEESYMRALEIDPDYAEVHNNLGNNFRKLHKARQAETCYRRAIEISPDYADAHNNLGVLLKDAGRLMDAKECTLRALQLSPGDADAHNNLAAILLEMGHFHEAEESLRRALQIAPDHVRAHNNLASVLKEMMRREEARQTCSRALSIAPDDADALHGLANLHLEEGRSVEAMVIYERILQRHPENFEVRHSMALARKTRENDANFTALNELSGKAVGQDRAFLHYALGKCCDDRGEYEKAYAHFSEGAKAKRAMLEYRADRAAERFARIARDFDEETMAGLLGAGDPSDLPVFVLGMPRSGTTLVEQIIASHPGVQAGGELPDLLCIVERNREGSQREKIAGWGKEYIRALEARAPSARRITDKMPANFFAIGLIHAMLPHAKIIHVRRSPLDTCLSCYTQLFRRAHEYSYDLSELGRYYAGYAALMEHWRNIMPEGSFLEVDYEDVVADIEGQARRMIEHCGLEWSDACLGFYENARPVQTASMMQVRNPVYSSSVGRWRNYEPCLGQLFDALGDLAATPWP